MVNSIFRYDGRQTNSLTTQSFDSFLCAIECTGFFNGGTRKAGSQVAFNTQLYCIYGLSCGSVVLLSCSSFKPMLAINTAVPLCKMLPLCSVFSAFMCIRKLKLGHIQDFGCTYISTPFVLTASQDTVVAFSAWSSTRPVQAVSHGTIILNHASTNIGNAYDTTTGVFTAPVSGLYDFQATIMPNSIGHEVYAAIVVDNARVAMAVADTDHDDWDQSTLKAVVHVNAGQKVRLKNGSAPSDYHAPYTTFSGILVKAD